MTWLGIAIYVGLALGIIGLCLANERTLRWLERRWDRRGGE